MEFKFYGNIFLCLQLNKATFDAEHVNITNLTAEIESFVRTADTDQAEIKSKSTSEITLKTDDSKHIENRNLKEVEKKHGSGELLRESPENNDFYSEDDLCEEITIEKIQNLGITDVNSNERNKSSPVKILVRAPTDEKPTNDESELTTQSENDICNSKDTVREFIIADGECVVKKSIHEESAQTYDEKGDFEETKATQDTEGM